MPIIKDTVAGRFSTDMDSVMDHVRKPVFVDNAVHHAKVEVSSGIKNKITIEDNNSSTFQVMPETRYDIVEGESSIQITHKETAGHSSLAVPFLGDNVLSATNKPMLVYNADVPSQRLAISTVEDSNIGILMNLRNMKGKTLDSLGLIQREVNLGQPIDVGLRTTDLAIRLSQQVTGGINSVNLGGNLSNTNNNNGRRRHSNRFIGQDFTNVNLMTALRYIARHDSHMILLDRFGNLLYIPITFSESNRTISVNFRSGAKQANPIDNTPNRVTVQGDSMALNDLVIVSVDDTERQSGVNGEVREDPSPVMDMTVNTTKAAKRVARQILRGLSLVRGSISSEGHPDITDLRPGMTVSYGGEDRVITEIKHMPLTKMSDITMMNVDTGIEGVLQSISEGATSVSSTDAPLTYVQIVDENLSMFGKIELRISTQITERGVNNTAFLIGGVKGTKDRGKIGGTGLPIGANKTGSVRY
tara:strand:+ start:2080 stop:3498 length:1419 start_codon:yes stop_codon:yes gene_type:complete